MKGEQARATARAGRVSNRNIIALFTPAPPPFAKAAWQFPFTAFSLIEWWVVIALSLIIYCPGIRAEWMDGRAISWNCFPSTTNSNLPTGLTDIVAISSGVSQNLALRKDGTVVS